MNGTTSTATSPLNGTQLIDDFLRQQLGVGNPNDALEMATALRKKYAADSARIDQEGLGLTIPVDASSAPTSIGMPAVSFNKIQESADTLMADFAILMNEPANRGRRSELQGWRDALMAEWSEGIASAQMAKDSGARERAFYAIRKLSNFAATSRFAGTSYQELFYPYRRVASSLDLCGSVIRVLMGESLYYGGLSDGGFLVSLPLRDLRAQKEGLVEAVRALSGVTPDDPARRPRGLASYSSLRTVITNEGRSHLFVYLREDSLTPILDGLVGQASRLSPDALRQLAASSLVDVANLNELLDLINRNTPPISNSPALRRFREHLILFLSFFGFAPTGPTANRLGARLIHLAMPGPLASINANVIDFRERGHLTQLSAWRHALAAQADAALPAPQIPAAQSAQYSIDLAIYLADRTIDHLAQGQEVGPAYGIEEYSAAEYVQRIRNVFAAPVLTAPLVPLPTLAPVLALDPILFAIGFPVPPPPAAPAFLSPQIGAEVGRSMATWLSIATSLSPR